MSYELASPALPRSGSRVARGRVYAVDSRGAGTASAARARRVADGVSGYGNLAGYEGLGFSLLNIVKPLASFIPGGNIVSAGISLAQGAAPSTNAKDPERLATAQSNLQKALAGDANAYLLLQQQAGLIPGYGSATQYGKDVARAALAEYERARGAGVQPAAPVLMSPLVPAAPLTYVPAPTYASTVPTYVPNYDTGAPVGVGGGVNPILLLGAGIAAALVLRRR